MVCCPSKNPPESVGYQLPPDVWALWLLFRTEYDMRELMLEIWVTLVQSCNPDRCIKLLKELKGLKVTAIMLKKQPLCFESLRMVRVFVGDMTLWRYTDAQKAIYLTKAPIIHDLALEIFNSYKILFNCSSDQPLLGLFLEEVAIFEHRVKDMNPYAVKLMYVEPNPGDATLEMKIREDTREHFRKSTFEAIRRKAQLDKSMEKV